MRFDDHPFIVDPTCNHSSTPLVPGSVNVFELVWVNPWSEHFFILLVHWMVDGGGTRMEQSGLRRWGGRWIRDQHLVGSYEDVIW